MLYISISYRVGNHIKISDIGTAYTCTVSECVISQDAVQDREKPIRVMLRPALFNTALNSRLLFPVTFKQEPSRRAPSALIWTYLFLFGYYNFLKREHNIYGKAISVKDVDYQTEHFLVELSH